MTTGASKQWRWSEAILPAKLPVIVSSNSTPPKGGSAKKPTVEEKVTVDVNQLIQRPPQTVKAGENGAENTPHAAHKGKRLRGVLVTKPTAVSPRDTLISLTGKAVQPKVATADVDCQTQAGSTKAKTASEAGKSTPHSSAKSHKAPLNPSNPVALNGRQTLAELAVINYQKQVEQFIKQASVSRNHIMKPALPSVFRD